MLVFYIIEKTNRNYIMMEQQLSSICHFIVCTCFITDCLSLDDNKHYFFMIGITNTEFLKYWKHGPYKKCI